FRVLISRGLDIADADCRGIPLAWRSPSGLSGPWYFEPEGLGWLRTFYGGLVVTCGLTTAGAPSVDQGKELGLHGRFSTLPASGVATSERWEGDDYVMSVRGQVQEAVIFGENVLLTREITTRLGENRFWWRDVVENVGYRTTEHMILYHINGGYPAVAPGGKLVSPTLDATPRDADAEIGKEEYAQFSAPVPDYREKVYYHNMAPDAEGRIRAALINEGFAGGHGFGFYVTYRADQLPRFTEWKMMGQVDYVVGMEPANCLVEGRARERERGTLQFLEPGERREYEAEIGVLDNAEAIRGFQDAVQKALKGAR
ncbi:MAG: aldose 1-epimerase family protein, partial [Armatimonadota bacterium]